MNYTDNLSIPEGPVALKDGSWLVVEMGPDRGCITHITGDGKHKRVVAKTGRPNGLAVDRNSNIWCAETQNPALLRVTMDGKIEEFLTNCNGTPFLFPNDLCFGPDGALYLTDSGILFNDFVTEGKVRQDFMDIDYKGRVYKIDVETKAIEKIDDDIRFTNGICFGPGDDLYVNETITGNIFRYRWENGNLGPREIFGNVISPDAPEGIKGPDGMCFGQDGRLYVTVFAQKDITVLDVHGNVYERIETQGTMPTNVAFGLGNDYRIYVTEDELGTMEVFEMNCGGYPLYRGL